jgi:hypothetical protein
VLFRTRSMIAVAGAALAICLLAAPAASQDYPGTTVPLGPVTCTGSISASGALLPNASVDITATGSCLVGAGTVNGVLQSTPIALPTVPVTGSSATFPVRLPADWELNAFHTISVTDADTGALLLTNRFYVDGKGRITSPPKAARGIPRTGSNSDDLAKGGIALVAVGAGALAVARRRKASTARISA